MTPTEQEIKFFFSEEAKRIQEEWEPKIGDYAVRSGRGAEAEPHIVIDVMAGPQYFYVYVDESFWERTNSLPWKSTEHPHKGHILYPLSYATWLPRQGQLCKMLEKKGYYWVLSGGQETANWCSFGNSRTQHEGSKNGPTPSIALGKCLLEVLSVQHPEGKER